MNQAQDAFSAFRRASGRNAKVNGTEKVGRSQTEPVALHAISYGIAVTDAEVLFKIGKEQDRPPIAVATDASRFVEKRPHGTRISGASIFLSKK
jgi:hypothetical protein